MNTNTDSINEKTAIIFESEKKEFLYSNTAQVKTSPNLYDINKPCAVIFIQRTICFYPPYFFLFPSPLLCHLNGRSSHQAASSISV